MGNPRSEFNTDLLTVLRQFQIELMDIALEFITALSTGEQDIASGLRLPKLQNEMRQEMD